MACRIIIAIAAAVAFAAVARAEDPVVWGGTDAAQTPQEDPSKQEREKVAEIERLVGEAKYDEAIEQAKVFLRYAKVDECKAEATRLVAVALRKKQDWKLASGAYLKLRDRYGRGSDEYVMSEAVSEILRASPTGVYVAGGTPTDAAARNLADDAALAEALRRLAANRVERLKLKLPLLRRARTGQDLLKQFLAFADELRQARVLSPDLNPDTEREIATITGLRMAEIGGQVKTMLTGKKGEFDAAIASRRLNTAQRKDMEGCQSLCTEMAKAEETFQNGMARMTGTVGWTEGGKLVADSNERKAYFEKQAPLFTPPRMGGRGNGGDWDSDWLNRNSGGIPGGMGGL
jgi:hypothetical protein